MSFITDESGVETSIPIELYVFTLGATVVRYADRAGVYTYSSNNYTGVAGLKRRSITRDPVTSATVRELEIEVAASVFASSFPGQPPNPFSVTVTRVQPTGAQVVFIGDVASIKGTGETGEKLTLRCESKTGSRLKVQAPGAVLTPYCRHILYGNKCRAVRTDHDTSTTVSSVTGETIVVATVPANTLVGGEIWGPSGTERRTIVKQSGTTLTVNIPFISLAATNSVTLYDGCDKSVATCDDTFNNVIHFGGAPYAPFKNPHTTSLQLIE